MNVNKLMNLAGIIALINFISLGAGGGCNNNGESGMSGGDEDLNGDDEMGEPPPLR